MISIVIPAYNEQWRLPPTLSELQVFMKEHPGLVQEIIISDDGSRDATISRAMRFTELPLRFEIAPKNEGKWAAISKGIAAARNDIVLLMDADGSASLRKFPWVAAMSSLKRKRVAAIFGSRFMTGSHVVGKSALRTFVSQGYRQYVRAWYWLAKRRTDVDDMQCPMKLIKRSCLVRPISVKRWSGDVELALLLEGKIISMPVQFEHKRGGTVRPTMIFEMAWETATVCWKYIFRKHN